jgi:hypothetical protein
MVYLAIPLIALGLLAVYWGVRVLLSEEFTRYLCQSKWHFLSRLSVKLLGLERTVVVARWSSPFSILIGVGGVGFGVYILLCPLSS